MKTAIRLGVIAALMLTSACASRANSIAPVAVTSTDYSNYSCDKARAELQLTRDKQNALARRQNNAAVADAAGVFLLLIPVGSIFGADVAGELAQAKGEVLALERHIKANCDTMA